MKYALALMAALALSVVAAAPNAYAQQKGPNGGPMEDIADVDAELIVSGSTVTINVFDEDKKAVATKGFNASVLIVAGAERETVTLQATGENSLSGNAKKPIASTATISLTLKTAAGKSGQVRFKR